MNYEMQELIPIVAELTDLYTSKESTSITYEKANQLMEAVLFCIQENEDAEWTCPSAGASLITQGGLSAKEAYEQGRKRVQEKVCRVRELYNRTAVFFCAYGNCNYEDTFIGGIPGFLKLYDIKFAPQNSIITMDYPILQSLEQLKGVDAIYEYANGIYLEQIFLSALPKEYVLTVLERYYSDYQNLYCNICNIVLHDLLKCMISGKKIASAVYTKEEKLNLSDWVMEGDKNRLKEKLMRLLKILIEQQYPGNEQLYEYLCHDMDDFAVELKLQHKYGTLERQSMEP
jgi:uncharacterized membrane protein